MRTPHPLRALVCCLFLTAAVAGMASQAGATSTAGAMCLQIPPGVRGEAMGTMFITEANDYSARWWNPAGLAFVEHNIVGTMYSQLVPGLADDVYFMYLGWVAPTYSIGTLQFDLTYLSYGQSEATDVNGLPNGTFKSYELAPAAGLGFKFLPNLGVGVAVKYVRIDLAPKEVLQDPAGAGSGVGASWAFDLGALYRYNRLRVGGVVSNLGPDITFIDAEQSDPMPRTLRLGGMYDIVQNDIGQVRAGLEWERSLVALSTAPVYHGGAEFVYLNNYALRLGYLNDATGDVKGFSGGFGVSWAGATLEYANVPQATDLDRVHRFALWLKY